MKTILIDSNIPFIATGQIGEAWAVVILEQVISQNLDGVIDALYLQELLDRSVAVGEVFAGKKLFSCCRQIFTKTLPVTVQDFDLSCTLYKQYPQSSPRDLIHAAVAKNNSIDEIFSIDGPCFDEIEGIKRTNINHLLTALNIRDTFTYERKNISRS